MSSGQKVGPGAAAGRDRARAQPTPPTRRGPDRRHRDRGPGLDVAEPPRRGGCGGGSWTARGPVAPRRPVRGRRRGGAGRRRGGGVGWRAGYWAARGVSEAEVLADARRNCPRTGQQFARTCSLWMARSTAIRGLDAARRSRPRPTEAVSSVVVSRGDAVSLPVGALPGRCSQRGRVALRGGVCRKGQVAHRANFDRRRARRSFGWPPPRVVVPACPPLSPWGRARRRRRTLR